MNGHFVPPEIFMVEPLWLNFFTNMATVQFDHRLIAWALMALVPVFWWRARRVAPREANLLLLMLVVQVGLGIATLLHHVPLALAAAHQAGAMLLFAAMLWINHALRAVTWR
jgi:cytochrome c oxidase assembly protein subunit 15